MSEEEKAANTTNKSWIADGGKLLESELVSVFDYEYMKHFGSDIISYNGRFYGVNGLIKDDDVKYILLGLLTPEIQTNLSRKINNVMELMKIAYKILIHIFYQVNRNVLFIVNRNFVCLSVKNINFAKNRFQSGNHICP